MALWPSRPGWASTPCSCPGSATASMPSSSGRPTTSARAGDLRCSTGARLLASTGASRTPTLSHRLRTDRLPPRQRPADLPRAWRGLDTPGAVERLVGLEDAEPLTRDEGVRGARHGLHGEASPTTVRQRVATEDHQVGVGLVHPERDT